MNRNLALFITLLLVAVASAQEKTYEQMGGVYYAYPAGDSPINPAPPEGYQPFYISHYGRHGSRWLPSDSRYEWVVAQLSDKKNLTAEGKRLRKQLGKVWRNARGHGGQLTPLGGLQHEGIASRMVTNFPEVFADGSRLHARSSVVPRCASSMAHFLTAVRDLRPSVHIDSATDSADMQYIAYTTPELRQIEQGPFAKMRGTPDRLMRLLFKTPAAVADPVRLMSELHTIASDMQDVGTSAPPADLYWLFTPEEMYDIYACNNARMAYVNGDDPRIGGAAAHCALSLWHDIERRADEAIVRGTPAADLRFGHDTNLYRLLSLLQASSAQSGKMDEILPMAANLQMVFFRNAGGDVLVRLLHNERDFTLPIPTARAHYYRWSDIKAYMAQRIHQLDHLRQLDAIHTMVGTAQANTQSAGRFGKGSEEHGQTLPAVLTPNGQNCWTPQTRDTEKKCVAPYYYADTLMYGLRCSHWIVGGCTQDYGSATLTALGGTLRTSPEDRVTPFAHAAEVSHPHYYAVGLPREHLRVELTATAHGAVVQVIPDCDQAVHILLSPNSDENEGTAVVDPTRRQVYVSNPVHRIYQGWGEPAGFSGHLLMEYEVAPTAMGCFDVTGSHDGILRQSKAAGVGVWLTFDGHAGEPIVLRLASSFTSREGCERNMRAEVSGRSFDEVMRAAAVAWTERLHTIDVEDADTAAVTQFYGALYRASILPRLLSDADGAYPRFASGDVVQGTRPCYTDYSMWDTYRALHPLYNLIAPQLSSDMMQSLVNMAGEGGWLPIFPCWNSYTAAMIGDHCSVVLADAYVKGIRGFDAESAYSAMRRNAFDSPASDRDYADGKGRRALRSYLKYGYIPLEDSVKEAFHTDEQTSRTLEYAFDDFAVAQMAQALGHDADHRALMQRSGNWRHVINPITGYADGRHADGRFEGCTDFFRRQPFITEGAPCHYTWYVPHNPQGLIRLLGGKQRFASRLDSLFTHGLYWHGNEPCHQMAYLFDYAGRHDLTRKWVRHIMRTEYNDTPGGLSGNDDAGQMSAWYVFSALGFYPVCPATEEYMLGAPLFRRATLNQAGGSTFVVETTEQVADGNPPTLDGQPLTTFSISHRQITHGGRLQTSRLP